MTSAIAAQQPPKCAGAIPQSELNAIESVVRKMSKLKRDMRLASLDPSQATSATNFETQADELWSALDVLCDAVTGIHDQLEDAIASGGSIDGTDTVAMLTATRNSLTAAREILLKHGHANT